MKQINENESVELLYNFQPHNTDFRAVFPALKQKNFDAIGVYILANGHNAFFRQARAAGVKFKALFGTDGFDSKSLNQGYRRYS